MSKVSDAIKSLDEFNQLCDVKKIKYKLGKEWTGRKVTVQQVEGKQIQVTFNELMSHLDKLAKQTVKEEGGKEKIITALNNAIGLNIQGKVNLKVSKGKMTTVQKIVLAIRQFFGNLGNPTHLKQLANLHNKYLPVEKAGPEAFAIKNALSEFIKTNHAEQFLVEFDQLMIPVAFKRPGADKSKLNEFLEQNKELMKKFEKLIKEQSERIEKNPDQKRAAVRLVANQSIFFSMTLASNSQATEYFLMLLLEAPRLRNIMESGIVKKNLDKAAKAAE